MRSPDDIHDEWLVLRCQDGDAAALTELVDRWQPRLLRHALRLTGPTDSAADVVQATWVAIIRGLSTLHDPACFRRWAYQIVTHKCADWVRRRQRDRGTVDSLDVEAADGPLPGDDAVDDVDALRKAMRQLPPEASTVLAMYYVDEMPIAEIAEVLAVPAGTVKSRLHHAKLKLKQILERTLP